MRLEIESSVSSPIAVENGSVNGPDVSNLLKQGVSAAQNGDRPMARTLLSNVTDADPNCVDAWLWLASISEYPEELLVFLKKVLDIEPNNERALTWEAATRSLLAKTHVQRGVIAAEEGNHAFAMQCFDDAIANDELCESAWYWKASLSEEENEKLELLAKVLEIDPDHADAKDAVNVIEQARASAKMHEAKKAAADGNFDTACGLLDEIHAAEPENFEAWVLRAHVVRSFEEKLDAYDRILHLDPSNVFAQYGYEFLDELAESVKSPELLDVDASTADLEFGTEIEPHEQHQWTAETETETNDAEHAAESEPVDECPPLLADEGSATELESQVSFAEDREFEEEVETSAAEELWAAPAKEYEALREDLLNETDIVDDSVEKPLVPFEEPASANKYAVETVAYSYHDDEFVDPIAGFPEWDEPVSMVSEEAAHEADTYASPTAETQEFRAEEHDLAEAVAGVEASDFNNNDREEPSYPFESEVSAQASPWDTPVEKPEQGVQFETAETPQSEYEPASSLDPHACPYCEASIERQAFECTNCNAVLSLSDIELLLSNNSVQIDAIRRSVAEMEADWNSREFSVEELKALGVGQFNLKNFELGFAYIQEASRLEPNDVILAGQLNALAIRLDEIKRQEEINEAKPKGKTILVVDDSPTVRKLISSKLEKSGHQVVCAVDGVEAMTMIESMVPDLVLLDIAMPRMDGYQVCKLIRANEAAKDVPVVMISGKDGFFDKVRGRMAGTTGYITKPFGPETLMKALETYLIPEAAGAE